MSRKKKTVTKLESNYVHQYDAYIERQNRKKQRLLRRLGLFSVAILLVIVGMIGYHWNQQTLYAEKAEQYEQLEIELQQLQAEEQQLEEEINRLNDDEYVLDIARTNYFFTKEGELIFKLPDETPSY